MSARRHDAVVVGAGPNGLAAAVTLARAGRSVLVIEARDTVGGGCRSAELTLPGVVHDVCAAVHPLVAASPFFRSLPLDDLGVELVHPGAPAAHPLDDGGAVVLERSVAATAAGLGPDAAAYAELMEPLVARADALVEDALGPVPRVPRHPAATARLAPFGLRSAAGLARARFRGPRARALLAGMAAHSFLPLEAPPTAALGVVLQMLGHHVGWPVVRGGSQRVADGLARHLTALGGEIATGWEVADLGELPPARAVLLDVTAPQLLAMAGARMPARRARALRRVRPGPGVVKIDWALDGPIPWRAPGCARAGTVHLGGTLEEIAASERAVHAGRAPGRPYVLLAQQGVADPSRAPGGLHAAWAYCHVPKGSGADMAGRIEAQVERFAPGFGDRVVARSVRGPAQMERDNPNQAGGDITGGLQDLRGTVARPVPTLHPYAAGIPGVYLCSAATPPGGGVHGMCGHLAARAALGRELA